MNHSFGGSLSFRSSFGLDGIRRKHKKCISTDCSANLLLGAQNRSLYEFLDFVEVKSGYLPSNQSVHCLLHLQPNVFLWNKPRHIWCGGNHDLVGQIS